MALRNLLKTSTGKILQPPRLTLEEGKLTSKTVEALYRFLVTLTRKINGHLSLGDGTQSSWTGNSYGQWIEFYTPAKDTQIRVDHGLGRTPVGRKVVAQDKAGSLYDSNKGGWGDNAVYFKCDVANVTFKIELF